MNKHTLLFLEFDDELDNIESDLDEQEGVNDNTSNESEDEEENAETQSDNNSEEDDNNETTEEEPFSNSEDDENQPESSDDTETDNSEENEVNADDSMEDKIDIKKKYFLFQDYKKLLEISEIFLNQVDEFKQIIDIDNISDLEQIKTIEFLESGINDIINKIKFIIKKEFLTMSVDKLDVLFSEIKKKIDILVDLFKQINKSEN